MCIVLLQNLNAGVVTFRSVGDLLLNSKGIYSKGLFFFFHEVF